MDDKEKEELEKILSKSRQIQVAEIKERENQRRQKSKVNLKEDLLEINNESKKETAELTKSKKNNTSLKCNLL